MCIMLLQCIILIFYFFRSLITYFKLTGNFVLLNISMSFSLLWLYFVYSLFVYVYINLSEISFSANVISYIYIHPTVK